MKEEINGLVLSLNHSLDQANHAIFMDRYEQAEYYIKTARIAGKSIEILLSKD